MKVLFLIPKNPPPILEGNFSKSFKDFVELCLRKDPRERPSSKELLKHPFVRKAKKTIYLTELIERYERWQTIHGNKHYEDEDEYLQNEPQQAYEEEQDLWDFGTVRPVGGRAPGLRAMNDAATNARTGHSNRSSEDSENSHDIKGTVKQQSSPQKSPVRNHFVERAQLSPSKVPLPASPVKHQFAEQKQLPNLSAREHIVSNDYDRNLQADLAEGVGSIDLAKGQAGPAGQASTSSAVPARVPSMTIPEIPPFKGNPGRGAPLQKLPHQPSAPGNRPVGQQPLPSFSIKNQDAPTASQQPSSSIAQQPLPSFQPSELESQPRNSNESSASTVSTTEGPSTSSSTELTALNSVLLPALGSALNRRTHNLKELSKTKPASHAAAELQQRRQHSHEKIRKLVVKAAGIFGEIERRDREAPVGMGGDVGSFLEGILEEVLVRVDAGFDDEGDEGRK